MNDILKGIEKKTWWASEPFLIPDGSPLLDHNTLKLLTPVVPLASYETLERITRRAIEQRDAITRGACHKAGLGKEAWDEHIARDNAELRAIRGIKGDILTEELRLAREEINTQSSYTAPPVSVEDGGIKNWAERDEYWISGGFAFTSEAEARNGDIKFTVIHVVPASRLEEAEREIVGLKQALRIHDNGYHADHAEMFMKERDTAIKERDEARAEIERLLSGEAYIHTLQSEAVVLRHERDAALAEVKRIIGIANQRGDSELAALAEVSRLKEENAEQTRRWAEELNAGTDARLLADHLTAKLEKAEGVITAVEKNAREHCVYDVIELITAYRKGGKAWKQAACFYSNSKYRVFPMTDLDSMLEEWRREAEHSAEYVALNRESATRILALIRGMRELRVQRDGFGYGTTEELDARVMAVVRENAK